MFILGALVGCVIVFPNFTPASLLQFLGIGSVAIGFAFRDVLQNYLAGILLLLTEPFRIGDQIRFGSYEGTVEEIQTRATLLKTYDGRRVVIPNSELFTNSVVVNTAFEVRRLEYDVGIGYGDDVERARALILEALRSVEGVHRRGRALTSSPRLPVGVGSPVLLSFHLLVTLGLAAQALHGRPVLVDPRSGRPHAAAVRRSREDVRAEGRGHGHEEQRQRRLGHARELPEVQRERGEQEREPQRRGLGRRVDARIEVRQAQDAERRHEHEERPRHGGGDLERASEQGSPPGRRPARWCR
jgi:hypothetical protein